MNLQDSFFLLLKVVAEVSGCHSGLKTSAPVVLGTVPLISYQPPFAPIPKVGGDMCGGIGWTAPSVPYMQPNIPPPEPHAAASAPQLDGGEECEEPSMPFDGPTAPLYPNIRTYK